MLNVLILLMGKKGHLNLKSKLQFVEKDRKYNCWNPKTKKFGQFSTSTRLASKIIQTPILFLLNINFGTFWWLNVTLPFSTVAKKKWKKENWMQTSGFHKVYQPESIMYRQQTTALPILLHREQMRILYSKKSECKQDGKKERCVNNRTGTVYKYPYCRH